VCRRAAAISRVKNKSVDRNPLRLGGQTFKYGVGTHAESTLEIDLKGQAERFTAVVGVDDEVSGKAGQRGVQVDWRWQGVVYERAEKKPAISPPRDVDLYGVKRLLLDVNDAGDASNSIMPTGRRADFYKGIPPVASPPSRRRR